jgi:hypothetical protein
VESDDEGQRYETEAEEDGVRLVSFLCRAEAWISLHGLFVTVLGMELKM